jgi:hypothetical protein
MGPRLKLPRYVHGFVDRHGRPRFYFRRPGFKRAPLPGLPWSGQFMEAYEAALDETPRIEIGGRRTVAGTVNAVVIGYFGSAAFQNLAPASRRQYRGIIERFRCEHGEKRIAKLERRNIMAMLDAKARTPVAARDFLRCLRLLIRYAIDIGLRDSDPTLGIKTCKHKSDGFRTWSEDDITVFESHYPIGNKPRLALELLPYGPTARRCDTAGTPACSRWRNLCSTAKDRQNACDPGVPCPSGGARCHALNAPDLSRYGRRKAIRGNGVYKMV